MKKLLSCALVLAAAGCASSSGPRNDAPDLGPGAQTIEQQQNASMEAKIDALTTSMTELLERLDVLNDRVGKLESASVVSAPARVVAAPESQPQITVLSPEPVAPVPVTHAAQPQPQPQPQPSKALASAQLADTYRNALILYGRGKMEDARRTFQLVFDQDPTGDLADNALYWIGETYYATSKYAEAMKYYKRVTVEFSEQNKAPDALFKIALAYEKTSDLGMAKQTLDEVLNRYPYSGAAASAKLELKRIRY